VREAGPFHDRTEVGLRERARERSLGVHACVLCDGVGLRPPATIWRRQAFWKPTPCSTSCNPTLNQVDFLSYLAALAGMSEQTVFEGRLLLQIWVTQEEAGWW
jgi:hypothetical protein